MYAIIKTGAKQYKVSQGDRLKVERLEIKPNEEGFFYPILVFKDNTIDLNENKNYKVRFRVLEEGKHKKVLVFHKKRRKQYKKLRGHRQLYSLIEIVSIEGE